MGRGGRRQMAGMARGLVSGVILGSLVGGLVLLLAALVLDLGPVPERPDVPDVSEGPDLAVAQAPDPSGDSRIGTEPVAPDAPDGPGIAPVLLQGVHGFRPPAPSLARPIALAAPGRPVLPRPALPVLPRLITGGAMPMPVSGSPVVATLPAPVGMVAMPPMTLPAPETTAGTAARAGRAPGTGEVPPRLAPAIIAAPSDAPQSPQADAVPPPPAATALLRTGLAAPPMAGPPAPSATPLPLAPAGPMPAADGPVRAAVARLAAVAGPDRAAPPPAPGPRVAFILDGTTDARLPGWLQARATPGDGPPLRLDRGGVVFVGGDARAEYLAARAAGAPALLAYARLDAAEAVMFDRIALRARRDGAVAVLVRPDPALWDRIGAWLAGPARDLVPVPAERLLE